MIEQSHVDYINYEPKANTILKEVIAGLSKTQKTLPPKLLYDKRGSEIFEKICLLKEYYPTRTEAEILKTYAGEISRMIGPEALIIEPGSGAGDKVRYLLPQLIEPKGYLPVEISKDILVRMTEEFNEEFPDLKVFPVCADFGLEIELPLTVNSVPGKKVIFFPGSTIGNFTPQDAIAFLKRYGKLVGRGGGLLIGVDLKKDPEIFKMAYDDPHGVTAAFNKNLLERLNREACASFDLSNFVHEAIYNEELGRVEMHLVSRVPQMIRVNETMFRFNEGESIHTENSYKYSVEEFSDLCGKANFSLRKHWQDVHKLFCVYYFERD